MRPDPTDPTCPAAAAVCVYPDMVATAREALGDSGVHVAAVATAFPSGRAALDIKLADERGSGIDVLVEAKRHLPGLRGIVLSNYATPQHVKASADAGASYFLDKSTEFDQIIGILKTLGEGGQAPVARPRP